MPDLEDEGECEPLGPHGARVCLVVDADKPQNRIYRVDEAPDASGDRASVHVLGSEAVDVIGVMVSELQRVPVQETGGNA